MIFGENFDEFVLVLPNWEGHPFFQHLMISGGVRDPGVWIDGNLSLGQAGDDLKWEEMYAKSGRGFFSYLNSPSVEKPYGTFLMLTISCSVGVPSRWPPPPSSSLGLFDDVSPMSRRWRFDISSVSLFSQYLY